MLRQLPRMMIPLVLLVTLVAACEQKKQGPDPAGLDPAVAGALGAEIMVDPDLAGQNPQGAVLAGGGPAAALIPPEDTSREAIAAAKAEAGKLLGRPIQHPPEPMKASPSGALAATTGQNCAAKAEYTMAWAARLPANFPVYPRGHVQEAAGTDGAGCHLRVVNFLTPVALGDVLDFYWTLARNAGFSPQHQLDGADHVISGQKGSATYRAYVRSYAGPDAGLTEVDLITDGE